MRHVQLLVVLLITSFSAAQTCKLRHTDSYEPMEYRDASDNVRSDTIDVLKYTVNLDITDFTGMTIGGNTVVRFTPLMNGINTLSLDLLTMTIDSVTAGPSLTYSYNDTLLICNLPSTLNISDTLDLTVYYHGSPAQDPSGIGGWYWDPNHSYNLGVGLTDLPHNYGRVWHPCFDNFEERATYEFNILTDDQRTSYCNGYIAGEVVVGTDSVVRTWMMDDPIPSYLANIAVGRFTHHEHDYMSSIYGGNTPVWLIAEASDTVDMINSFANIDTCLGMLEAYFGPHSWNKVGFVKVPFGGGALEHATNITYPAAAVTGTLLFENIMAHEMTHHWFGDLVTCEYAEEMWINEGFAEYGSFLFTEAVYSRTTYNTLMRAMHADVLHLAHINDNGFHALNDIPQAYTYGDHAYYKGASVAHSLRGYLGDSVFFEGLSTFISANQHQNVNSIDLRDHFNGMPGVDVNDFFDDWVFQEGFAHFSIDSMDVTPNGPNWDVTVYVRQRLTEAPSLYNNVPMDVTFMDANRNEHVESIVISGANSSFSFTIPIEPQLAILDKEAMISDALVGQESHIGFIGIHNFSQAEFRWDVDVLSDTAYLRVEHHWTQPDAGGMNPWHYRLSPNRYWTVLGILPTDFAATARLQFNGNAAPGGYYDVDLMANVGPWVFNEDSLVLLYRPGPGSDWSEYPYATLNTLGSSLNKIGRFDLDSVMMGEYVFALKVDVLGTEDTDQVQNQFAVYPNPTDGFITVDVPEEMCQTGDLEFVIFDVSGRYIQYHEIRSCGQELPVGDLDAGEYVGVIRINGEPVGHTLFIVK